MCVVWVVWCSVVCVCLWEEDKGGLGEKIEFLPECSVLSFSQLGGNAGITDDIYLSVSSSHFLSVFVPPHISPKVLFSYLSLSPSLSISVFLSVSLCRCLLCLS